MSRTITPRPRPRKIKIDITVPCHTRLSAAVAELIGELGKTVTLSDAIEVALERAQLGKENQP